MTISGCPGSRNEDDKKLGGSVQDLRHSYRKEGGRVHEKETGADQGDITIKSDQEPGLISFVCEIGPHRAVRGGGTMVVESSPVDDSQGNDVVERAIKSVQGQIGLLTSALEDQCRAKLEPDHR